MEKSQQYPELSVLEGTCNFFILLDRHSQLYSYPNEHYEIYNPDLAGNNILAMKGSKAVDKMIRFQHAETDAFVFNVTTNGSNEYQKIAVSLHSGFVLGRAEPRGSTGGDKIWDHASGIKFVTKTTMDFPNPGIVIRDAITKQEFARINRPAGKNSRTLTVTYPHTTSEQKAIFLGYSILRIKRGCGTATGSRQHAALHIPAHHAALHTTEPHATIHPWAHPQVMTYSSHTAPPPYSAHPAAPPYLAHPSTLQDTAPQEAMHNSVYTSHHYPSQDEM